MNTKQIVANLFETEIPNFVHEILELGTYCHSKDPKLEHHYAVALRVLSSVPHEFVVGVLDENFTTCKMRYAFVYDHAKECHLRGDVVTYEEYKEFNQRFPRAR